MRKSTSSTSNNLIGRDFSSNTQSVTNTSSGKFRSRSTTTSTTSVINKNGEVLSTRTISSSSSATNVTSGLLGSALGTIFGLVLLVNIFAVLSGYGEYRGAEWIMNTLANAWAIPTDWMVKWSTSTIDAQSWGAFEFLGNFLNRLSDFTQTIAFLGIGALNVITFIVYLLVNLLFVSV